MRGRRPPGPLVVVGIAIAVVAVLVVVVRGRPGRVRIAARTTTTSGLAVLPGVPGSLITVGPDTTTVTVPATSSTAGSLTTTPAISPTTTSPTTTTATVPTDTTSSPSTTVSPVALCGPADLQTVTATEHNVYPLHQPVTVTVMVTNVSGRLCRILQPYPATLAPAVRIIDSGMVIWQPAPPQPGVIAGSPEDLGPGGFYQWAKVVWPQLQCVDPCAGTGGSPVGVGVYQAVADSPPSASPAAAFTVGP